MAIATDDLLELVALALREIDDRPVSVTARRTARLASMLGESELAVLLGLELKPSGGLPAVNANETRALLSDPGSWAESDGPASLARARYLDNREVKHGPGAGKIEVWSLRELEDWLRRIHSGDVPNAEWLANELRMTTVLERVRHTCFVALCGWERRFHYANVNERIFERFRGRVDAVLAAGVPDVLEQFSAVYRRLREAAGDPEHVLTEELSQAVSSCRRILKAVADHLRPAQPRTVSAGGHKLDDSAYRNRILEYVKGHLDSEAAREPLEAAVGGLFNRFAAIDRLASKGVHADVGLEEAERCALHTYILTGELLTLADLQQSGDRSGTGEAG